MIKTVIGSFDSFEEAREVVRDLKDEGFMESDISIVASNTRGDSAGSDQSIADRDLDPALTGDTAREPFDMRTGLSSAPGVDATAGRHTGDATGAATGAVTGGVLGGAAGVAVSLMGLAIPGIGPIVAAGPIVAGLTGAGVGAVAGGLIGGLTGLGVSEEHAEYYAESVRRGGALVTIRCDEARAERAAQIMQDHGAIDIERRVETWRDSGWTGYDQSAPPSADQTATERSSYAPSSAADARSSRSRAVADWSSIEGDFRREHEELYAGESATFDEYAPAYRYGYEAAQLGTYRDRSWDDVEPDVRRDWERSNPGSTWEKFKAAVRRGWDRLTGDTTLGRGSEATLSSSRADTPRR